MSAHPSHASWHHKGVPPRVSAAALACGDSARVDMPFAHSAAFTYGSRSLVQLALRHSQLRMAGPLAA
eukprot:1999463-Pyramimonas_sp.AAC.1